MATLSDIVDPSREGLEAQLMSFTGALQYNCTVFASTVATMQNRNVCLVEAEAIELYKQGILKASAYTHIH